MGILERTDGQADGQVMALVATDDRIIALGLAFVGEAGTYQWTGER